MAKTKTPTVTVTGPVTKVELKMDPGYDSGRYGRETWDAKLLVAMTGPDGPVYFYTPGTHAWCSTSGPYSVAGVEPNDWITHEKWDCKGFAGARGLGRTPAPRIKVGDTITVSGKVKKVHPVYGTHLYYVKRHDYDHGTVVAAARARFETALKKIPTLPGDVTPPTIPGVEWSHIGGYPERSDPDNKETWYPSELGHGHAWLGWEAKVVDKAALVAWAEGVDPATVNIDSVYYAA